MLLKLFIGRRQVEFYFAADIGHHHPVLGHRDYRLDPVGQGVECRGNMNVVESPDCPFLGVARLYGLLRIHRAVDRRVSLLSVEHKFLGRHILLRSIDALKHSRFEIDIRASGLQEHSRAYRIAVRHRRNQRAYATVFPYPAALKVGKLKILVNNLCNDVQMQ